MEVWRQVVESPYYEVSNFGSVRSWRAGNGRGRSKLPKVMRQRVKKRGGYMVIQLGKGTSPKFVHRLVLEAFVGGCPDGMECRHADGIASNNMLSNLNWSTHIENMRDQYKHGTRICGETHHRATLTDEQVGHIRIEANRGTRGIGRALALEYGVTPTTISFIKSGKTRKEILCKTSV